MKIPYGTYNEINDVLGLPQEFKGVKFHPIKLCDKDTQTYFKSLFSYSRSEMYDLDGIYKLERLINEHWINVLISHYQHSINPHGYDCLFILRKFLSIVCKLPEQNITIGFEDTDYIYNCETCIDKNIIIQFYVDVMIEGTNKKKFVFFDSEEFDYLRQVICKQNGLDYKYIDEWNKSFEEDLQQLMTLEKWEFTTIDEEILTYKELSGISYEELRDITISQFKKGYNKQIQINDYKLNYLLYFSGNIKLPSAPKHYTFAKQSNGRYDQGRSEKDDFIKNNDVMK